MAIELRYRFAGEIFANVDGEQLHEELVPDVDGQAVRFAYHFDHVDGADARAAAEEIASWLREDRGAAQVELAPEPGGWWKTVAPEGGRR